MLNLENEVIFTDYVPEEELPCFYNLADVFVLASLYEGFGLPILEAMACGCPAVGMNRGSIPEIIQNGVTGYVVEDVEGMISAVEAVGNIDRKACREHVLANFSAAKMADGYEAMYAKMLEPEDEALQ